MFDLKNIADDELMKLYREEKDRDSQLALSAFKELYSRYYDFMYSLCQIRFHGSVESDIMFERTWECVMKHPTYCCQKHNTKFSTWLSRIARNVAYDIDQERLNCDIVLLEETVDLQDNEIVDEEQHSDRRDVELMTEGLNALPERERDILLTYMEYDTGDGKYLPRDIIKTLCEKFHTTAPNLRKIKERSLQFLKNYVESHR